MRSVPGLGAWIYAGVGLGIMLAGLLAFLIVIGRTFAAKRFGHAEETAAVVTSSRSAFS